jgi:uncharacterized protein (TIGR03435 family)
LNSKLVRLGLPLALAASLYAQSETRRFESAEVRVSLPGRQDSDGYLSGARAELKGMTMLDLIQMAYAIGEEDYVVGGPHWLGTDRFDISAKAPTGTADSDLPAMLQTLLAERFALQIHREDRPVPVYALTAGKRPKLKESAGSNPSGCDGAGSVPGQVRYNCQHMTMADFASRLRYMARAYFDHPVIDLTGLKGAYDFTISWTGRAMLNRPDSDQPSISIFDAVDKQLGLKLELQKQPVSVVVVDKVNQKPIEDPNEKKRPAPVLPTEFEVASIRPTRPDAPQREPRVLQSGQLELPGTTLMDLITTIYDIEEDMVVGAPPWLKTDRFDVVAKAAGNVPFDTLKLMMRKLLGERFQLKIHNEDQPVRVYALTAGKNIKVKESSGTGRASCKSGANGAMGLTCQYTTMEQFVARLRTSAPAYFDHPAVDLTGLPGVYDFALTWTPKGRLTGLAGVGARGDGAAPAAPVAPAEPGGMSVFEAVDKQLGLKLTLQKHTMPVIVIDHVERTPTEN